MKLAAIVCLLWVGLGLFGHDPWKPDEIYTVDLVYNMARGDGWVVPELAGEPFVEKPPIFFLTAAGFARALDGVLPLHDAARLANALYLALTLVFLGAIARHYRAAARATAAGGAAVEDDTPATAPLLFVACLGMFELAHSLQTDLSLLAGVTLALLGLARAPGAARLGGLLLGTGTGLAFMSKGLVGPALIGVTTLGLLASPAWRTKAYVPMLGWAALAFLPWGLIWPALLHRAAPDQFHVWFWYDNVGRFFETKYSGYGPRAEPWFYTRTLPWFAFPALPLALLAFRRGRAVLAEPRVQLPLVAFITMTTVLALARDARINYALPLLPPLALLGALGLQELREAGRRAWFIAGVAGYGIATLALWLAWLGLVADVHLAPVELLREQFPGYVEHLRPLAIGLAATLTAAWLVLVVRARRARVAPALAWAGGMTLLWGLFTTLALPAVDHDRTYRALFADMDAHRGEGCVCSFALGEPERAMLEYFDGMVTERLESHPTSQCPNFLVQTGAEPSPIEQGEFSRQHWGRVEPPPPGLTASRWREVWRGHRPRDPYLVFVLYERVRGRAISTSR